MNIDDAMLLALSVAKESSQLSEDVPVGAVVLDQNGLLVASGSNERELLSDPTGHAEIVALRRAASLTGKWRLEGMTLVVTLEPCAMCAGAIAQSRISRLAFGAWDKKAGAVGSVWDVLRDPRSIHKVEVVSGVMAEECAQMLSDFFLAQRGYGITIRVEGSPSAQPVAEATAAITKAGATITALDVVESLLEKVVVDVTCDTINAAHAEEITQAISAHPGLTVRKVSDRTFLLHLGGKLEVQSKVPLKTRDDLSRAYTPGVARICQAIVDDPSDARRLTIKRNTVAVVTDGSAVLGLGNIGPAAALPVMEGKAALFKRFADVDAWPVCLDTQDVDEIVRTVQLIAPVYGGINLEDISAPRCFEVERRLRELLDIPVFHDDQHGTAIVVLAALRNSLKLVKKDLSECKIVMSGAGAAGTAIARLLTISGAKNIIAFDTKGAIHSTTQTNDPMRRWFIDNCNPTDFAGTLSEGMKDADIFIGVSAANILKEEDVASMGRDSIVFALANPDPEIDPVIARKYAAVVATGRSDQPNQINNVLAFPGIFRGLLDANAHTITDELLVASAEAIAACVSPEQLNTSFIVPSVFDPNVVKAVAAAVKKSV